MSLIANYAFDSSDYNGGSGTTITDHSGNANTLTKTGSGGSWDTDDPFNDSNIYSFHFNKNQHFERAITLYTSNFSVAFWFRPDGSSMVRHESIAAFSNTNNEDTFQIGTPNAGNLIQVQCKRTPRLFPIANYTGYGDGTGGTNGNWNHVAVTFDNTNAILKVYFNGSLTNTYNRTSTPPTTSSLDSSDLNFDIDCIKIGTNRQENNKFGGWLTLLGVYDEELSSTDISGLYNNNELCYHPNTNILTDYGYINIVKLMRGDKIFTLNGYKPLSKLVKTINIKNKFIKFTKGSIDEDTPKEDLMITTGHPVYLNGEYYLPENFLEFDGVFMIEDKCKYVYHLIFDTHEVILSNGLMTTSLPPNTEYNYSTLKEEEYYNKKNYKKENIGKMYPPYILHENPLFIKKIDFVK
jgi:hypothetical protein